MWISDPKDGKKSISLTMMVASFLVCMIVSILQVLKQVDSGGMSMELFVATMSLYFGRRFSVKTKNMEMSNDAPVISKEEG